MRDSGSLCVPLTDWVSLTLAETGKELLITRSHSQREATGRSAENLKRRTGSIGKAPAVRAGEPEVQSPEPSI